MRYLVALSLALAAAALLPGVASAAKPSPVWPGAQDIRKLQPSTNAKGAACMARFYNGRLTLAAWRTPWMRLTRAEKIVTQAGIDRCSTRSERVATLEQDLTSAIGNVAQGHCAARVIDAMPVETKLSLDTNAKYLAFIDGAAKGCHLTGALYARTAGETKLVLTPAAEACANDIGALAPVFHRRGASVKMAYLKAIGTVFDRCVAKEAKIAMWRSVMRDSVPAGELACVSDRLAATLRFTELFTSLAIVKNRSTAATLSCMG